MKLLKNLFFAFSLFVTGFAYSADVKVHPVDSYVASVSDSADVPALKKAYQEAQTKMFTEMFNTLQERSADFILLRGGIDGLAVFLQEQMLSIYGSALDKIKASDLDTPWSKENTGLSFYLYQAMHNAVLGMLQWALYTFQQDAVALNVSQAADDCISNFYKALQAIDAKISPTILDRCFAKINETIGSFEEDCRSAGGARARFARAKAQHPGGAGYSGVNSDDIFALLAPYARELRKELDFMQAQIRGLQSRSTDSYELQQQVVAMQARLQELAPASRDAGFDVQRALIDVRRDLEVLNARPVTVATAVPNRSNRSWVPTICAGGVLALSSASMVAELGALALLEPSSMVLLTCATAAGWVFAKVGDKVVAVFRR